MLVDMVMPTVNRNEHLAEALNSAGSMSVPVDLAWELIVIDKNSNDDTRSVVQHWLSARTSLDVKHSYYLR